MPRGTTTYSTPARRLPICDLAPAQKKRQLLAMCLQRCSHPQLRRLRQRLPSLFIAAGLAIAAGTYFTL